MIKRRFYRHEHADRDDASDSSVSSSDCEPEPETDDSEESEDNVEEVDEDDGEEAGEDDGFCSPPSGYESEDSSINEFDADSSGLPSNEDDVDNENEIQTPTESQLPGNSTTGTLEPQSDNSSMKESLPADIPECILKCKSVFKCRICPRVVCLNEETLRTHLMSKRHARSEKLLKEGRLKIMLNSIGEIENSEDPTESPPRVTAFPLENHRRKNKSQERVNKKGKHHRNFEVRRSTKGEVKRRRKAE